MDISCCEKLVGVIGNLFRENHIRICLKHLYPWKFKMEKNKIIYQINIL